MVVYAYKNSGTKVFSHRSHSNPVVSYAQKKLNSDFTNFKLNLSLPNFRIPPC